eukprot:scaffold60324_cov34-Cyclotella_meneghiniana.AAC.2
MGNVNGGDNDDVGIDGFERVLTVRVRMWLHARGAQEMLEEAVDSVVVDAEQSKAQEIKEYDANTRMYLCREKFAK